VSTLVARKPKLATRVVSAISERIASGELPPGAKLETETELVARFGVSRTVIREAVAALAAGGLVEARQGAGVFVRQPTIGALDGFLKDLAGPLATVLNVLELRLAVEVEAAALAALRRSPSQEAEIREAFAAFDRELHAERPTAEADFAFHLAVTKATNNPFFAECLRVIGRHTIPRALVSSAEREAAPDTSYLRKVQAEHAAILDAIADGNSTAAQAAMREHLVCSQRRYQQLIQNRAAIGSDV
jgi:DNA-binding FadR family transcriptional regulator